MFVIDRTVRHRFGSVADEAPRSRRPAGPLVTAPPLPAPGPARRRRDRAIRVAWTGDDRLRALTVAAGIILAAAPVMAVAGIPRVPLMWPFYRLGIVLPGCGLTRGVVALARGDVAEAWGWNPASVAVAALAPLVAARFVVGRWSGRWAHVEVRPRWWLIAIGLVAVGILWVNQQANADLLMQG